MTIKYAKRNYKDKKKNYGYMLRQSTWEILTQAAKVNGTTRAVIIDDGVLK
jgi:hypothetical protein